MIVEHFPIMSLIKFRSLTKCNLKKNGKLIPEISLF